MRWAEIGYSARFKIAESIRKGRKLGKRIVAPYAIGYFDLNNNYEPNILCLEHTRTA